MTTVWPLIGIAAIFGYSWARWRIATAIADDYDTSPERQSLLTKIILLFV